MTQSVMLFVDDPYPIVIVGYTEMVFIILDDHYLIMIYCVHVYSKTSQLTTLTYLGLVALLC